MISCTAIIFLFCSVLACSGDYVLNPISNTCIRLVQKYLTYAEAKADCEAAGEYLAVFPTVDSVQWLLKFMNDPKTPSGRFLVFDFL